MSDNVYKIFILEMEALMLQYEDAVEANDISLAGYIWSQMKTKLKDMGEIEGLEVML